MAAKKDFSKDTADIFGLRQRKEMEARQKQQAAAAQSAQVVEIDPAPAEPPAPAESPAPVELPPPTEPTETPQTQEPLAQPAPKREPSTHRSQSRRKAVQEDTLTTKTFRITKKQHKALQMRMALSDSPAEKDLSSIVRAALDMYLKKELRDM